MILVLLIDLGHTAGKRKRLCKKKKGQCVDIIPRKDLKKYKKYKICRDYDESTLGKCYKINGTCKLTPTSKGKMICGCEQPGRYF